MDPVTWISGITALASMVKAWSEARKAGLDLEAARERVRSIRGKGLQGSYELGTSESNLAKRLIIKESLLKTLVKDIEGAGQRFEKSINDPRYTPADIDREHKVARLSICTHLNRIRDFNAGQLPQGDLKQMWTSWNCESEF